MNPHDPLGLKVRIIQFKLESEITRRIFGLGGLRPSSQPFLSGDGYRALARHRYEKGREHRFHAESVRAGDLVFCEAWLLADFFAGPAKGVTRPFVLISSNGDPNIDDELIEARPPTVIRWFAQNLRRSHPVLEPLPIGLENRNRHANGVISDFRKLRSRPWEKASRILYGFAVTTNPTERTAALEALGSSPLAEALVQRLNPRLYREVLVRYRFVASPEGNGLDCHRTWEAMYLKVVPIVRRSAATERFAELGLPVLVIDDWNEVLRWSEADLEGFYREREPRFNHPALWMDYWKEALAQASELGS